MARQDDHQLADLLRPAADAVEAAQSEQPDGAAQDAEGVEPHVPSDEETFLGQLTSGSGWTSIPTFTESELNATRRDRGGPR